MNARHAEEAGQHNEDRKLGSLFHFQHQYKMQIVLKRKLTKLFFFKHIPQVVQKHIQAPEPAVPFCLELKKGTSNTIAPFRPLDDGPA